MVLGNPGRTGFLFISPPRESGVETEALVKVVASASTAALAAGLSFTQALVSPEAKDNVTVLLAAGYEVLADLLYLKLDLDDEGAPDEGDADLTWRRYGQYTEEQLGQIVLASYEGSLDCPRLAGVRRIADVIAGHKSTGVFRPETWWVAERSGSPAACILVNDSITPGMAEVVYMGVAPAHRGRGLGRAMLRRAARVTRAGGLHAVTLAVDSRNVHAGRLYEAEGFRQTDRRTAYALFRSPARP
jgi:ribosomal protein S18 acetylase RimI-like enzyme